MLENNRVLNNRDNLKMINTFNCKKKIITVKKVNYLFNFEIVQSNDFYVSFFKSITSDLKRFRHFTSVGFLVQDISIKFLLRTINFRIFQV